ncbi:kinase-like protein [Saccharata proteae CBS 121410]|uniref:Kinase-like protein n=1 Tax=Saccharata proteae CBS 121410 TaxID=1314787 RepID=A0A9P4HTF6_9PEZI|nr:kinase-like protein [Saccharata proteae CBS 121410]
MATSNAVGSTKPASSIPTYTRTAEDGVLETTVPYSLLSDAALGTGLWSSVYLASPTFPTSPGQSSVTSPDFTPPATPVTPVSSHRTQSSMASSSRVWAIKVPANKTAKGVIRSEAHIMTRISSCAGYEDHVVPFIGLDPQNGSLMMQALPLTLEDLVRRDLASLDRPSNPKTGPSPRAQVIANTFPTLAASLLESLEWLHSTAGIIHADIKPSNILLRPTVPSLCEDMLLYGAHADPEAPNSQQPLGGGTWDYLAPELCRLAPAPVPNAVSDLYALGITLLFVLVGASPFEHCANNAFRKREMVKMGDAVACVAGDDGLWVRFCGVKKTMGWDVEKWLRRGLRKKVEDRPGVGEWKRALVEVCGVVGVGL